MQRCIILLVLLAGSCASVSVGDHPRALGRRQSTDPNIKSVSYPIEGFEHCLAERGSIKTRCSLVASKSISGRGCLLSTVDVQSADDELSLQVVEARPGASCPCTGHEVWLNGGLFRRDGRPVSYNAQLTIWQIDDEPSMNDLGGHTWYFTVLRAQTGEVQWSANIQRVSFIELDGDDDEVCRRAVRRYPAHDSQLFVSAPQPEAEVP